MSAPDWVQAMRARCATTPVPVEWSNPLYVSPLADVPALLELCETLGAALEAMTVGHVEFDDPGRVYGHVVMQISHRAMADATAALAAYRAGPGTEATDGSA